MRLAKTDPNFRLALVGIGNELNGDDGIGVAVVRALQKPLKGRENLLLLEAGPAPEAFTGPLRRFAPQLVALIDAADMGEQPGCVQWLPWQAAEGMSASTHTLPPTVLSSFLVSEIGCEVALIGIQPAQMEMEQPLSPPVRSALRRLSRGLTDILQNSFPE